MRIRDIIRGLPVSRIAEVTAWGMGDPQVIPRSLGRRHVHIGFNRVGRDRALQDGHTFYMYKAGLPEGRSTTAEYLTGLQ